MLKSFIQYRSGNVLFFPSNGSAPALFLEWVRDTANREGIAIDVCTKYSDTDGKNISDMWDIDCITLIGVRMPNRTKQTFIDARDYINANLPI